MNLTKQIPEITRRIIETSHPEKIILFGSYARGNFNADSERLGNTNGLVYQSALSEGKVLYECSN